MDNWGERGGKKDTPLPKVCDTYSTITKLSTVLLYVKKTTKHMNRVAHSLSSPDISIFSSEISKFSQKV